VQPIIDVAKDLFTGDFDLSKDEKLAEMSWNYDSTTQKAANNNINLGDNANCVNCFTHFELDVHAELHITGYEFESMMVYVEGQLNHHMEVNVFNNGQTITGSPINVDKILAVIHLPFINVRRIHFSFSLNILQLYFFVKFMVGPIPVSINTTVPIHGGLTLHYAESGTIQAHTSGTIL
jgi:hypothetical protein